MYIIEKQPKIDSHTMVFCNGFLFVFGGFQNGIKSSNLYKIEIATLSKIEKLERSSPWPCNRSNHSAVVSSNCMYVFGGSSDDDTRLGDMWKYDTANNIWTEIKVEGGPMARCNHSLAAINNSILLFGGQSGIGKERNDMWLFDGSGMTWKCLFDHQQRKFLFTESSFSNEKSFLKADFGSKGKPVNSNIFSMLQGLKVMDSQHTFYSRRRSKDTTLHDSPNSTQKTAFMRSSSVQHSGDLKSIPNDFSDEIVFRNISSPSNEQMQSSAIHGLKPSPLKSIKIEHYNQPLCGKVPYVFPYARDGQSAVAYGRSMVIFGGDRNKVAFNDVFTYSV
jgi:hypothetical protein